MLETGSVSVILSFQTILKEIDEMRDTLPSIQTSSLFTWYGKFSKISDTFRFLFSIKMLIIQVEICKLLVIIADREDPDNKKLLNILCIV